MYACGDTVVYRHHVCEVAALRENYFEGKDYLELRALFENSLKLFVAVDEATPDNLRPIMSKRAALALIDSIVDADTIDENALKPDAPTPTLLERRMKEEYDKRLRTFAPEDLVPIMKSCLLYTSDAADDMQCVDLGGRRIIKKKIFSSRRRHTRSLSVSWARRCV